MREKTTVQKPAADPKDSLWLRSGLEEEYIRG